MNNKVFKIIAIGAIASLHAMGARPVVFQDKYNRLGYLGNQLDGYKVVKTFSRDNILTDMNDVNSEYASQINVSNLKELRNKPLDLAYEGDEAGSAEYYFGTYSQFNPDLIACEFLASQFAIFNRQQNNYYQGYNISAIYITPYISYQEISTRLNYTDMMDSFDLLEGSLTGGITVGPDGAYNLTGTNQLILRGRNFPSRNFFSQNELDELYYRNTTFGLHNIRIGIAVSIVFSAANPAQTWLFMASQLRWYVKQSLLDEGIYQSGYDDGYQIGTNEGYNNGYSEGYNKGVGEGNSTIKTASEFLSAVTSNIQPILEVQVLPGVNIGTILLIPIVLGLFLLILNFIKN